MKKRADFDLVSVWFLIELVGAFLVGYMAVDLSVAYAQGTAYEKLNLAKDIAMQINTLSSVQGNAYLVTKNNYGYSVSVTDNKIEVFEDDSDQLKASYYFVKKADSKFKVILYKPNPIVVSKIGNSIKISAEIPDLG